MIEIKSNLTLPKIDLLYAELEETQASKDLKLPKELNNNQFGVLFSLLQFIGTWIRHPHSGSLILPVTTEEEALVYLRNEFVYPIVVLSWEKEILGSDGRKLKSLLAKPSQAFYQELDFFNGGSHSSIPIYCFDHDLSKRGKSRVFYEVDNSIVSEAKMDFTLHPAFEKLSNYFNRHVFKAGVAKELTTFYGIIHELFSNTHEHARTSEKGYNLYPNIRAVYFKFYNTTLQTYQDTYKEFPGLVQFFCSDFNLNLQNQLYLIELSIMDSGPGLYKRYSGKSDFDVHITEEIDVIKQCLYIHNTSSVALNKENKGIGLDRMLRLVDGKGFIRIKSGRADVFRDLRNHRYHAHDDPKAIMLSDWRTNSPTEYTVHKKTEGTLISIFYPLDFTVYE